MPARSMCDCFRLFRDAAGIALLCLATVCVAQSAREKTSRPRQAPLQTNEVSGATTSAEVTPPEVSQNSSVNAPRGPTNAPTPMSSAELASQLSGVKDNSLLIANKYISGPLTLDATQRPITPVTFKVEFRDCEFTDDVVVRKVDFGQSVTFQRVKFDKELNLEHIHVKGDLQFENVQAGGLIKLNQSQVDGDVRIKDPVATGLQVETLTANNLIVSLGKRSFATLDFVHLTAGRLSLLATGAIAKINQLDLGSVSLKETLVLQNLDVQVVTAEGLTVAKHMMFLPVTTIRKSLDLSSAEIAAFEWRFAEPVQLPEKLNINGAVFGSLAIVRIPATGAVKSANEASSLRADRKDYGLAFLERAEYYEPAYSLYESSLKTRGQSDKADAVYFAMRDRRRYTEFLDANTLWQKTVAGFNYVIGFGHKWLFGYGRGWVYPLIWSVLFVIAGAFIFRTEHMQKVDEQTPRNFSPIWYSIDIFVPVLSLGIAKDWHPRQECRALQFYSKFLSLIGLIFISAMIGALTGSLK
ncbi:MAG: hypothetical protein WAK33_20115 [Silvibacterium sp.]